MRRIAIGVLTAAALVSGCSGSGRGDAAQPPGSTTFTRGDVGLRITTTGSVIVDPTRLAAVIPLPDARPGVTLAGTITIASTGSVREQMRIDPGYAGDRGLARVARLAWRNGDNTWGCGRPPAPCRVTEIAYAPVSLLLRPGEWTTFHLALRIPVNPAVNGRHLDVIVRFSPSPSR